MTDESGGSAAPSPDDSPERARFESHPDERAGAPRANASRQYGPRPVVVRPAGNRAIGCLLAAGLTLALGIVGMCFFGMAITGAAGAGGMLLEERIAGEGQAKVALIELQGAIMPQVGGSFLAPGRDLVETLRKQFKNAADDTNVKAVLLHIDSPGGAVTTSDQIWNLVRTFRKDSGKPVVVHMGAMCASGGYYIAVAADQLLCEPTTITGSIGVVLSTLNFHELLKEYGVKDVTIVSGDNKALLNPTSPVSDQHRQILQGMVDDAYERFVTLIAQGRPIPVEQVKALADGRIYTAKQALELKLVDAIGYREDAFNAAKALAGQTEAQLVRYKTTVSFAEALGGAQVSLGAAGNGGVRLELDAEVLDRLASPRLLALWRGTRD